MAKIRVVFLGTTGIEKLQIAQRLAQWTQSNLGQSFRILDFEKEYLTPTAKGGQPLTDFLAQPVGEQYRSWVRAWDALTKDGHLQEANENIIILIVHGCIVRGNYGVRCVCDLHRLAEFRPGVVVTLIDDVYNQWWTTERRAHGEFHRGRPSLEQLIMARRTEPQFPSSSRSTCIRTLTWTRAESSWSGSENRVAWPPTRSSSGSFGSIRWRGCSNVSAREDGHMTTVKVFMVGGDAGAEALAAKVAGMPGFRTEIYTCPKAIEDLQPTPFIEVDGSQRFFGKEGIETFLAQQASAKK